MIICAFAHFLKIINYKVYFLRVSFEEIIELDFITCVSFSYFVMFSFELIQTFATKYLLHIYR